MERCREKEKKEEKRQQMDGSGRTDVVGCALHRYLCATSAANRPLAVTSLRLLALCVRCREWVGVPALDRARPSCCTAGARAGAPTWSGDPAGPVVPLEEQTRK